MVVAFAIVERAAGVVAVAGVDEPLDVREDGGG